MKQDLQYRLGAISERCHREGACRKFCKLIDSVYPVTPGEIAERILNGKTDPFLIDFVFMCSLCCLCREYCAYDVDIPDMVRALRGYLLESGAVDREIYRPLFVDYDWNFISIYRNTFQIEQCYSDLIKEECDILFLPGCTLANEGVELVRISCSFLSDLFESKVVSMSLSCCGAPIQEMGFKKRAEVFSERLSTKIHQSGAKVIVTACPTCHSRLSSMEAHYDLKVVSIYELLSEKGFKATGKNDLVITIHDACPARHNGIGKYIREILSGYTINEMKRSGRKTVCCGSGGIVSAYNPETSKRRAKERLEEAKKTGADTCVTYCTACTHRLSAEENDIEVRHILELIFNRRLDHSKYFKQTSMMWEGDLGEYNLRLLQNSSPAETPEKEE